MSRTQFDEEWFEDFWNAVSALPDEEDGISAARLIGELLAGRVIHRAGDELCSVADTKTIWLSARDQHLVRRIEDAARHADALLREEER